MVGLLGRLKRSPSPAAVSAHTCRFCHVVGVLVHRKRWSLGLMKMTVFCRQGDDGQAQLSMTYRLALSTSLRNRQARRAPSTFHLNTHRCAGGFHFLLGVVDCHRTGPEPSDICSKTVDATSAIVGTLVQK